ncbi:MAG: hypothetical protein Q7U74_15485 [Saprospiraceae bacterium]|nr:hypothetical protein [Saprospiraceae bacterium]
MNKLETLLNNEPTFFSADTKTKKIGDPLQFENDEARARAAKTLAQITANLYLNSITLEEINNECVTFVSAEEFAKIIEADKAFI